VSSRMLRGVRWQFLNDAPVQLIGPTLKMGPVGCPETSLRNYHHTIRHVPEGRSSHLLKY